MFLCYSEIVYECCVMLILLEHFAQKCTTKSTGSMSDVYHKQSSWRRDVMLRITILSYWL